MERGEWKGQEEKGTGGVERAGEKGRRKGLGKERKGRGRVNRDVRRIEREGGEK